MANNQWLKILEMANVKMTDELSTGEVISVKVKNSNCSWRICLNFDNVVSWEILEPTMNQIREKLIEQCNLNNVLFTISYHNHQCSNEYLHGYYKAAIKACQVIKATVVMLEAYSYVIDQEVLKIKVATKEDQTNVEEHLDLIKTFMNNYGLNHLQYNVMICEEEQCLKDVRHEQQTIIQGQDEARSMEQYIYRKAQASASEESVVFARNKTNMPMTILLNEVPMTSMEIEEFRQTRNTIKVEVTGVVVNAQPRDIKTKDGREFKLFQGTLTDYTDSVIIKRFYKPHDSEIFEKEITPGKRLVISGNLQWDDYLKDVVIMCDRVRVCGYDASRLRFDGATEKRVELHAHTKMSVLDSILNVDEYVNMAKNYGHTALAVTDHANCHVLPDFFKLCKKAKLKPIAGVEAYFVDDKNLRITLTDDENIDLDQCTYVVFDIETTGLYVDHHEIIEIGAVKVKNGMIIERFDEFVKPRNPISTFIAEFTKITNAMVSNAPSIEEVLPRFVKFIEGCVLVAHNATFDTDFIYELMKQQKLFTKPYPCIDTLQLTHVLFPTELKKYRLEAVAKYFKIEVDTFHRAEADTDTTCSVFLRLLTELRNHRITKYHEINSLIDREVLTKKMRPSHLNILVKNRVGLKNFYKIISDSHTTHFNRDALLLRSVLDEYRGGLLIGSGCVNGDIFTTALEKSYDDLLAKVSYYDYLEVQPPECYKFLFEKTGEENADEIIKKTIKKIVKAGLAKNVLVVATGDVHQLLKEDSKYRNIYLSVARPNGGGPHPLADYEPLDMHFRSTTEMLEDFRFLGTDVAYEIVVKNTNIINNMIESYDLFPSKLYVPRDDFMSKIGVPSMKQAVYDISYQTAHQKYGEELPMYVHTRLQRELDAIIGNGFSSVYFISHLLVKNSNDNGYAVGSRGSVGSSFVATMMGITEVNPLRPHYVCPKCHYSAFKLTAADQEKYHEIIPEELDEKLQKVLVGMDLEDANCPHCGSLMNKDGVDIAFETFLGFEGEKTPDIDLNFSGEYQPKAHLFCQETFGIDNAFRAGTISTVMDKTAFAYVRDYYAKNGTYLRKAEMERIAGFIAGAKKTTGQHPGGIVVVPDDIEYTDIIPVQYPPLNDANAIENVAFRTSHFDYHSFESNLLKLDILGHDDPTLIKMLMDYVHERPEQFPFKTVEEIPYVDSQVLSLFSSKDALHIEGDDLDRLSSGTRGVPEFGTSFVRGMLETIKPKAYTDIIKVSGLSHGTDVWARNAEDLFKGTNPMYPKIDFSEVIGCRDDIMIYLLDKDLPAHDAFVIMEAVRKGKGLTAEQEALMIEHNVPDWYIYSCKKIQYMFPKAHATAYVIMALRIGWFKVHRPIYYYSAFFSKRAKEFDPEIFANGRNAIRNKINEIEGKIKKREEVTNKEFDLLNVLYIALEMILRGYHFRQIDINKSLAQDFVIDEDEKSLYLPFISVDSLGETVADSIIEARNKHVFTSKSDFELRTSVNKKQYARLKVLGVLDDLPDQDTLL